MAAEDTQWPVNQPGRLKGRATGPRPKHEPTKTQRDVVKALVSFGVAKVKIANYIGISELILNREYKRELDTGEIDANAAVAKSLYGTALKGGTSASVTAAIFWLRHRAGWKTEDEQQLLAQLEELQTKLQEAEERLSRITRPAIVKAG